MTLSSKSFAILFIVILLIASSTSTVNAITKEQYLKQKEEGQKALQQARATKHTTLPERLKLDYASNFITIELSRTCIESIKSNQTTICPSYKELAKYDTTDQQISGKFFNDKGFYHRGVPLIKNHQIAQVYQGKVTKCVDCNAQVLLTAKNIMIEASSFTYRSLADNVIKNFTRYEYTDRMVRDCKIAIIAWNSTLLKDTIDYLESGCTKTNYNEQHKIYMKPQPLTYDGAWYKYKAWLEDVAKLQSKQNCVIKKCPTNDTRYK